MDPKHLSDARTLSKDAFKQATERFLERKRKALRCEEEPDCGWHNGGSCRACKANEAA